MGRQHIPSRLGTWERTLTSPTAALFSFKLQEKKWQCLNSKKPARTPTVFHPPHDLPESQLGSAACPAQHCSGICWDTKCIVSYKGKKPFRNQIEWRSCIIFSGDLYFLWDVANKSFCLSSLVLKQCFWQKRKAENYNWFVICSCMHADVSQTSVK